MIRIRTILMTALVLLGIASWTVHYLRNTQHPIRGQCAAEGSGADFQT